MGCGLCHRRVLKHEPHPWVITVGGQSRVTSVLKLLVLSKIQIKTFFFFVNRGICHLDNVIIYCSCSSGLQIKCISQVKLSFYLV